MLFLLVTLLAVGVVVALATLLAGNRRNRAEVRPAEAVAARPPGCCGQHAVCERALRMADMPAEVVYYEDEELDRFAGRPSNQYTDMEADGFRDVLYTLRSEEVDGWVRSLAMRNIDVPDQMKDELFLLLEERREA